jgi:hypothetical protein
MMKDLVQLQNSSGSTYASVYYDESLKATVDIWEGPFESQEYFIKGLNCVLENIKQNRSNKWLADLSKIEGDFGFVKEYIPRYILPKAIHYGLRFEALVLPYDIFSILAVQSTMEEVSGLVICLFDNVNEARTWLDNQK